MARRWAKDKVFFSSLDSLDVLRLAAQLLFSLAKTRKLKLEKSRIAIIKFSKPLTLIQSFHWMNFLVPFFNFSYVNKYLQTSLEFSNVKAECWRYYWLKMRNLGNGWNDNSSSLCIRKKIFSLLRFECVSRLFALWNRSRETFEKKNKKFSNCSNNNYMHDAKYERLSFATRFFHFSSLSF